MYLIPASVNFIDMMSVMPFAVPSTTPVCRDVNSSGHGIGVGEGAQVAGVRAVFAYGDAAIRGQVQVVGGKLPPQSRMSVQVLRPGGAGHFLGRPADVDARGRFTVEGLPSGDYELVVWVVRPGVRVREIRQHVTLAEDGETDVTLTLDLGGEND